MADQIVVMRDGDIEQVGAPLDLYDQLVHLPFMVLPLCAAIDRFDLRLVEAGYDLYATAGAC